MAVTPDLVGAWRRSGLFIDGRRHVDYCDVLWLQTPEIYADIRLLIDPDGPRPTDGVAGRFAQEMAFAGSGTWVPPVMTWEHALDSNLEPTVDANPLSAEDGVLVERGHVPDDQTQVPFVEEWLRLSEDRPLWHAEVEDHRIRVEVGRWAVEVSDERPDGRFTAARYHRSENGWTRAGYLTLVT